MRFERIDLIRFGHFADACLELCRPRGRPEASASAATDTLDLHVIFGHNEAGKTTAMTAVEDLLFGIPTRTPYNFRYSNQELRLGCVISERGEQLEFRRRKGNQDTILGEGDRPLGDSALSRFLGGADRALFVRMFNLGHDRLAEGGRAILAAEDDVGRTLFEAGAGLMEFRKSRKHLDEEAGAIWAPRKSKNRSYYQLDEQRSDIERHLREIQKRPSKWKDLEKERDIARAECDRLQALLQAKATDSHRFSRIRRCQAHVHTRLQVDREIADLEDVVLLPEDAASVVKRAERAQADAAVAVDMLTEQLRSKRKELSTVPSDERATARADEIRRLQDERGKVRSMRADLPKREGEMNVALSEVRRIARDLAWDIADEEALSDRVPSPDRIVAVQGLLQQRSGHLVAKKDAAERLADARRRVAQQSKSPRSGPPPKELARLSALVEDALKSDDIENRLLETQHQINEINDRMGVLRSALRPAPADEVDIRTMPIPQVRAVRDHRDRLRDKESALADLERRISEKRSRLRSRKKDRDRSVREEGIESGEALDQQRGTRDDLWQQIETRYLTAEPVSAPPSDLGERFRVALHEADAMADRRFDRAEAFGRVAEMDRAIQALEGEIERDAEAESDARDSVEEAELAWRELWKPCGFIPDSPDVMLGWLEDVEEIRKAIDSSRQQSHRLEELRAEEKGIREPIVACLGSLGWSSDELRAERLAVLIRRADKFIRDEQEAARTQERADAAARETKREVTEAEANVTAAQEAWDSWAESWSRALSSAGLDPVAPPEAVTATIGQLEELRDQLGFVRDLREKRIGRMRSEIVAFEREVARVCAELDTDSQVRGTDLDLEGDRADEAVLTLSTRLERDAANRDRREAIEADIKTIEAGLATAKQKQASAKANLLPLQSLVGMEDVAGLTAAIRKSDQLRAAQRRNEEVNAALLRDGDGLDFAELAAECEGVPSDQVRDLEESAEKQRSEVEEQARMAAVQLNEAQSALRAFQSDAEAATLEAARHEALAGMRREAERYARVRAAAILLNWALERLRQEKQGPMLQRAAELFRKLTGGSFASLEVGFDSRDRMQLNAVRDDGEVTAVSGLSSGSEDQLFLALRIAAVEDYVDRGVPLPFVADDLFVNFDAVRSAAGLEILGDLARKTQVLFFTHHDHLVALAQDVLGESVPVIRLDKAA